MGESALENPKKAKNAEMVHVKKVSSVQIFWVAWNLPIVMLISSRNLSMIYIGIGTKSMQ